MGHESFGTHLSACDTENMAVSADPKSVKVNISTGSGMDIVWADGHVSHYPFSYLRLACPCALCDEERGKTGRNPGDPEKTKPGELPMFKPAAKPVSAEGVGRYAIRFSWNDNHDLGIYSWTFLREWCPCEECKAARAGK
jgi:prepilin-type processing-associated H-X9-DG protein